MLSYTPTHCAIQRTHTHTHIHHPTVTRITPAQAVIYLYDITSYDSFQNLESWLRLVTKTFGKDKPYSALIGNKTDLSHIRAVRMDKHTAFAEENDMFSYLMSAKTGDQVMREEGRERKAERQRQSERESESKSERAQERESARER